MKVLDIIARKRDGFELTPAEVQFMVREFNKGQIPDYQFASFLMAVYLRGMSGEELKSYTLALVESGRSLSWDFIPGIVVDKHSSGGVGDKTTLVVAPLIAAAGLYMAKMSGRGLGHTGGTIDKLESIPGFRSDYSLTAIREQVSGIGLAVVSQTAELTPADGLIYALRDVTATVGSMPLVAASIMSKKIAGGAKCIVLDVKAGTGAFMKTPAEAGELARIMISLGQDMGRTTSAIVSDMNQPLGMTIGNSLEVMEALQTLEGNGPPDLHELALTLTARLLYLAGKEGMPLAAGKSEQEMYEYSEELLRRGQGREKFMEMVAAQGGDCSGLEKGLPGAARTEDIRAGSSGTITGMDALLLGRAALLLGAGRLQKNDIIDPAAGIVLHAKKGDPVEKGDPVMTLHTAGGGGLEEAFQLASRAVEVT